MALLCAAHVCVPSEHALVCGPFSSSSLRRKLRNQYKRHSFSATKITAFFNPLFSPDDPILKEAAKEPIAFLGGVFAGLLRLDLKEDPLKEWLARTAQAAGFTNESDPQFQSQSQPQDETPQQIEIE